jgi:polysaccharide chain length determinant protein (PEP-CTERM system associated)
MPQSRYAQVFDIADKVLRSWWTLVAGVCIGLAASTVALHYTPKMYEASTTIYVAAKGSASEYIKTPVSDDLAIRLGALKEAVMSRPYMLKLIAEEYGEVDEEEKERLIRSIRSRVSPAYSRRAQLFEIRFIDQDRHRAARVANTLADLYIEENAKLRAERAGESTETLRQLMEEAEAELQEKKNEIGRYRHEHRYETLEREAANLQLLTARSAELDALLKARDELQTRLDDARAEKSLEDDTLTPAPPGAASPLSLKARIQAAEEELRSLRRRYRESHPEVQAKVREVEDLYAELNARAAVPGEEAGEEGAPRPSEIDLRIRDIEREIDQSKKDELALRAEIAEYERRINATPAVEQKLEELSMGLDALSRKAESYRNKYETARDSQKLEEDSKGSRFQVIEAAVPPSIPLSPKPAQLHGMGLIAGLLLFVGPVLLRQVRRPTVGSEARLRELSEVPILVSIPSLDTPATLRSARFVKVKNFGFSMLSVAILAAVLVTLR